MTRAEYAKKYRVTLGDVKRVLDGACKGRPPAKSEVDKREAKKLARAFGK